MLRLVLKYPTKETKEPDVLYCGPDGDAALQTVKKAKEGKKPPFLIEVHHLGRAIKRVFYDKPTKEELEIAKARDEKEAAIQAKLKGEPDNPEEGTDDPEKTPTESAPET